MYLVPPEPRHSPFSVRHTYTRSARAGSRSLGPIWKAGVPTAPIARSHRDLQNVLLDLCLKPPESATGAARTAPQSIFTPPHVPAFCSPRVPRGCLARSPVRVSQQKPSSCLPLRVCLSFQIGFVSPQVPCPASSSFSFASLPSSPLRFSKMKNEKNVHQSYFSQKIYSFEFSEPRAGVWGG